MSEHNRDPKTERLFQTRKGSIAISREQRGVPLKEFFQNAELPRDLSRAVVYATQKGPVLADADPKPWSAEQKEMAARHAKDLEEHIKDRGAFKYKLFALAGTLAQDTGQPKKDAQREIAEQFQARTGRDLQSYLNEHRAARGLPVREAPARDQRGQSFMPEQS